MDDRVREHAETLVDWSARVEPGDDVVVAFDRDAHDLAVATAEELGAVGANLVLVNTSSEVQRAYLRSHDGDFQTDPDHELALYEQADVWLFLGGGRNATAMADVESETRQAHAQARQGVREARLDTRWVSTLHPTRSLAQQAGMSYEGYREFVYDAVLRDWEALAEEMARLKDLLDAGSEVRVANEGTDLAMRIDDRTAVNSAASVAYDSHNLPSGEVFTAPVVDSVEGEVRFDVPMTVHDTPVRDVRLVFADGEVVDHDAAQGEDAIREVLETDDGARRLGELGVGMNRGIDRVTDTILFDEKMGGTVHLALGWAYDANLPEGETGNDSAVHVDLITHMREEGSRLEIDGEVVQQDGVFRWEPGYEG